MTAGEIDTAIDAFAAAGAERGLFYLSVPITSGRREFDLMRDLGVASRDVLRREHLDLWRDKVVRLNEQDAALWTETFAESGGLGHVVVNPGRLHRPGWTQDDYDNLWRRVLTTFPVTVVATPGWAYSRGARLEVALAIRLGIPVLDLDSEPQSPVSLAEAAGRADKDIASWGLATDIDWPVVESATDRVPVARQVEVKSALDPAAAAVFSWLVRERGYQLRKFGTDLDDEHTVKDGLTLDGWWWRQLTNYYHRASVLGVHTAVGRQALAKYVATACGLLESVVRVNGPLPRPGLPSGDLGEPE